MNNIPKLLHKIWIGPKEDQIGYSDNWLTHFPDCELKLWDNNTSKQYIEEMCDILGEMPNCSYNFVSDTLRLLIMRDYGGIYLDHDVEILRNFEELLQGSKTYLTFQYPECDNPPCFKRGIKMTDILMNIEDMSKLYDGESKGDLFINRDDYINACTIISEPKSPLIALAIDLYVKNYKAKKEDQYGMSDWGFGPQALSHAAELCGIKLNGKTQSNEVVSVFERSLLHPLHGAERLKNKEKYEEELANYRLTAYALHHHSFTNMDSYLKSIGTENFQRNAHAFTLWYKNI